MEAKKFKPGAASRISYIVGTVLLWIMGIAFLASSQFDDSIPIAMSLIFGLGFIILGVVMTMAFVRLVKFNIKVDDRGVTINDGKDSVFYSFEQYKFVTQIVRQRNSVSYLLLITGYDGKDIKQNTNLSKKDFQSLVELIEQRKMQGSMREDRTIENRPIGPSNFEEVFIQRREFNLNKEKIRRSAMNPVINAVLAIVCFGAAYLLTFTISESFMVYPIFLGLMFFIAIFSELSKFLKNTKKTPDRVIVDANSITFDNFTIPYNAITSIVATSTMQSKNSLSREMLIYTAEAKYQYRLGFLGDGTGSKVVLAQDDYNCIIEILKTAFVNRPNVVKLKFKG